MADGSPPFAFLSTDGNPGAGSIGDSGPPPPLGPSIKVSDHLKSVFMTKQRVNGWAGCRADMNVSGREASLVWVSFGSQGGDICLKASRSHGNRIFYDLMFKVWFRLCPFQLFLFDSCF